MNPQDSDLLARLRDIHAAADASWWPPAPGWWMLAVLLIVALLLLIRHAMQRLRTQRRRARLIYFVDHVVKDVDYLKAPQEYLSSLNRVFKIVAMRAFPERNCAFMQGCEWTEFLQFNLAGADSTDELAALAEGPYQPVPAFHAQTLASMARQWIRQHG